MTQAETDTAPPPASESEASMGEIPPPGRLPPFEPTLADIYDRLLGMREDQAIQHREQLEQYDRATKLYAQSMRRAEANYGLLRADMNALTGRVDALSGRVERVDRRLADGDGEFKATRRYQDQMTAILSDMQLQHADHLARSSGRPPSDPALLPLRGVTVVVLDDEPEVRGAIGRVCSAAGAAVVEVGTSEAARKALESVSSPAAATVDLVLGHESGLQFVRDLCAEMPRVGLVIVAGAISELDAEEARTLGVEVLGKPYRPEEVVAAIARARRNARAA